MQLLNAREKVFRPQGFLFSEKIPSPACRFRVAEKGGGICVLSLEVNKILYRGRLLFVASVSLCGSVVIVSRSKFTTEAQRATERPQRESLVERSLVTPSARWYS